MPDPETPPKPLCRRRFLALLALAGAGYYTQREPAAVRRLLARANDFLENDLLAALPKAQEIIPATPTAYAAFLGTLGLDHVKVSAVISPHYNRHGAVQNNLPPEHLWKNIAPTLRVVDRLAAELGQRVHINSAYRSPAYNATCPGAARWSQHLRNAALDVRFASPPEQVSALARSLRDKGLFRGGVGLYPNFTHIDTRGRNADW